MLHSSEEHIGVVRRSPVQNLLPISNCCSTRYRFSIAIYLIPHILLLVSEFVKMSCIVGTGKHLMVTSYLLCHNWRIKTAFYLAYSAAYGSGETFDGYILSTVPQLEDKNGILFGISGSIWQNVVALRGKLNRFQIL